MFMKKLLLGLLLLCGLLAKAQVYNNEWIDYSKTYYKFKVGKTGLYRIPQSVLASAGLGSSPAEHFQLWRNGQQIPIYTSVSSGALSSSDYIEFWGQMNDGKPDKELYRDPNWQLNDKWSLETDTASYFLTINTVISNNRRLQPTANNVAGTSLPIEPYFVHTAGKYFKDRMNAGYAVNVGEYLYSSSYDRGEGWTSSELVTTYNSLGPNFARNTFVFDNLNAYTGAGAPAPKFKIAVSGNLVNTRRYLARINSDSVVGNPVDFFTYVVDTATFSLGTLNSVADTVAVFNYTQCNISACPPVDRMVIHKYEITYPRNFNFNNQPNFEFSLPASATGNYLQITNFSYGTSTPVLYDFTNGKRYAADLSSAPMLKFVLEASSSKRDLVLVSEESSNITNVTTLQSRNFINYTDPANHGDYIIISNPILFDGPNGSNPVDDYRIYRSSALGGGYTAKIYLADEIVDQFGFGIKKNPAAIRNFLRYARNSFSVLPKHVLLIGKGVNYVQQRSNENAPLIDKLNLVPTFGVPASDVLLASEPGSSQPVMSIGRLSVVYGSEVAVYLKKVKEFEQAQTVQSPLIKDKAWMKNFVHIIGASEQNLNNQLVQNMNDYKQIIVDTLYGAKVTTFTKNSSDAVQQLNSTLLSNLFNDGISVITYFGHSSSTTLEFNLDNPENYENFGKYPMFIGLGCNVGNYFGYTPGRLISREALSEKYVLAPDRGTIGMIASTHFGLVHYLNIWANRAYKQMAAKNYEKSIGQILRFTSEDVFNFTTEEDFYSRCNTEQTALHGDPAVFLNPHAKPDYVIEDSMVKVSPGFVSIADQSFRVEASFANMGKAKNSSIVVEIKRQFPNQPVPVVIRRDTIPGIRYLHTIVDTISINPTTDKGLNRIIVSVDADNSVNELYENNNSITKDVMIYEDEARPVYPYNFAIVNRQNIKLSASTANPFSSSKQYQMELDTTELFNSPFKVTRVTTSLGGVMEFDPGISFTDSTVYYWRVAPVAVTGTPSWNTSSFVYLPNSDEGSNQSHFFQQLKSRGQRIALDSSSRNWKYGLRYNNLFVRQGSWVTSTGQEAGVSVAINGAAPIRNTCAYQSVVFNVFDPVSFKPWENITTGLANFYGGGRYGSATTHCYGGRQNNFEYRWDSLTSRRRAIDFMDSIPNGAYVVVRSFLLDPVAFPSYAPLIKYASDWYADEAINGPGKSLYTYLKNAGFSGIDSFNKPRQFALIYKKNDPSFTPKWIVSVGTYDNVTLTADCGVPDTSGLITSPKFGPALQWKQMQWRGNSVDVLPGDNPRVDVIGYKNDGSVDTLLRNISVAQPTVDISSINAGTYPFVQLQMRNSDSVNVTPYQLNYWRLTYTPAPEGAINPSQFFSMKDTVEVGEPLEFRMAFKNLTTVAFRDSIKVKAIITDRNNTTRTLTWKQRVLSPNPDTIHVRYPINTKQFVGQNLMYVQVNPDNDQPEQYHFNNFFYKSFYVRGDTINPLLDVTFDNVHILNHDIVSSKPNILIKLKDEAKWFPIDDPSTMKVQVKYPDGTTKPFNFGTDTLQFVPASQQVPNTDNTATAMFKPYFPEDGEYELQVTGKDMSQNDAGRMQYRVIFQVINKPMISNMLNYPNPFTTSTAFVFTLTGSEVPQNIRIQILTITGKVVREITKDELGPLHIGRNITEFKWDGTDQYGQKLANGVYLYRVITNLNGKVLDKYTSKDDETDKYFNKGYGKMYLMR